MKHKSTMLACEFGITTQSAVNNLMPLLFVIFKERFGLSYTMIANIILLNFTVQIATDLIAIKILRLLDYRRSGVLAQACAAFGLILFGILPHFIPVYYALITATVFMAFGGGLLEVMVSPIVDSITEGQSSAQMNLLHSFFSWGQVAVILTVTTAIKLFSEEIWWLLPIFWALVPIISIVMFLIVPIPAIALSERQSIEKPTLFTRTFLLMCFLMVTAGAAEITMAEWASAFAQKGLGISKFLGDILGPCFFAVLMGSGRVLYGFFGSRLNLKNALTFSALLCFCCYLTAAVANSYVALFACALTGFSVSIMWPGIYSYSSHIIKNGGTAMFGILALCGDVGCSLGSWVTGRVADLSSGLPQVMAFADKYGLEYEQIGLKIGLGCAAIFPLLMAMALIFSKSRTGKG